MTHMKIRQMKYAIYIRDAIYFKEHESLTLHGFHDIVEIRKYRVKINFSYLTVRVYCTV